MQGPILVFVEPSGNQFRKSSYEAITEGRRLADLQGVEEYALAIGNGVGSNARDLGKYGADHVLLADAPKLAMFHPEYYRDIARNAIKKISPSAILLPATSTGKDLGPRLAIHLQTGVATECIQLKIEGGELIASRPAYAGKIILTIRVKGTPKIATLRPNAFTAKELQVPKTPTVDALSFNLPESRMVVREFVTHEGKKLDLTE